MLTMSGLSGSLARALATELMAKMLDALRTFLAGYAKFVEAIRRS